MKLKNAILYSITTLIFYGCASTPSKDTANQQQQYITDIKYNLNNKQPNEALNLTKQLISLNSQSAIAYELQAKAYQQLDNYDKAEQSFQKALSLESANTLYRTDYADFLCSNGAYQDAIDQYQRAYTTEVNKLPTMQINMQDKSHNLAQIASNTGDCYVKQNLLDEAIESYDIAIQTKSASQKTYIGITKAYISQNNYPKAALYISSYPGDDETTEIIKLKIQSLSGLLNSNYDISSSNRNLLKTKIAELNKKLIIAQQNAIGNKSAVPPSKQIQNTSAQKNTSVELANNKPQINNQMLTESTGIIENSQVIISNSTKPRSKINSSSTTTASKTTSQVTKSVVTTAQRTTEQAAQTSDSLKKRIKKTPNGHHYIIVSPGDTLFNISQRSGLSQQQIINRNHLKNEFVPLGVKLYLD